LLTFLTPHPVGGFMLYFKPFLSSRKPFSREPGDFFFLFPGPLLPDGSCFATDAPCANRKDSPPFSTSFLFSPRRLKACFLSFGPLSAPPVVRNPPPFGFPFRKRDPPFCSMGRISSLSPPVHLGSFWEFTSVVRPEDDLISGHSPQPWGFGDGPFFVLGLLTASETRGRQSRSSAIFLPFCVRPRFLFFFCLSVLCIMVSGGGFPATSSSYSSSTAPFDSLRGGALED